MRRSFVWHTAVVTDETNDDVSVNPDQVLSPGESEEHLEADATDYVSQPAKVMRIGSMVKQLLDEARSAPLDEAGRTRLREIYETSVSELSGALSPDLSKELSSLAIPFSAEVPSESELRIAQAQLVGWLEGLFHGIQASLFAQQAAAAAQLEKMRNRSLPPGASEPRAGTYL
ncbi:MAG: proteasome activator [Acidimicrobiales bacterium]